MTNELAEKPMSYEEMIDTLKGLVFGTFDRTTSKEREALGRAIDLLSNSDEDCISRKATLNAIIKRLCLKDESYLIHEEQIIYNTVKDMPSIQPKPNKWIPTSERMPEDDDEHIITIRERWGEDEEWDYETTTAYYQNGKWSPSYDVDEGQEWKVIAWMPLPESYLEDYEET